MSILGSLEKYKNSFTLKKRLFLVNILILTSLTFVILKNIEDIRYKALKTENGETFIFDRFTSKIKVQK